MSIVSQRHRRAIVLAIATAVFGVTVSACGSTSSSSNTGASSSGGAGSSTSSSASSSTPSANVTAAQADAAPYTGKASAFPVDQPLTKRPAAGATLAYLQCSAVTCGVLAQVLGGVSKTLGVKLHIVSTGASVSDEVTAMNSIIASKPAIVVLPGLAAQPICAQMKQLSAQGAAVATLGMDNVSQCGVKAAINGESSAELGGRLLADWVVMQKGSKANVVFYYTPELSFSPFEQHAFQAQLTKLCPSCTARFVDLPLAGYGTSAPGTVVSDLQSHPQTNVALFVSEEAASGLPAAMKTAGLTHVLTNGWGPEPANLQDIKSGGLTGGVGVDVVTMTWEAVDAAARIATGQALTAGEQQGIPPTQLLAQKDITFNPATGFLPYPNVAQRFATLWAAH